MEENVLTDVDQSLTNIMQLLSNFDGVLGSNGQH